MRKRTSKKRTYRVRVPFAGLLLDGGDPVDIEYRLLEANAKALCSDSRRLQQSARKHFREVAELAIEARISKHIETKRGGSTSAKVRRADNVPRDRRIHDAHARGVSHKRISFDEGCSESTVSRVLRKPRP